jgi:hypothetical protein
MSVPACIIAAGISGACAITAAIINNAGK